MPGLLRERTGHQAKVGTVELFFDLVFVFAVTQISHYLLAHLTVLGTLQTLIMFMGVWWVWIYTGWVTNWLDPERSPVRLLLFMLMAAALVLAMSIPKAWDERGFGFALGFAFIQVGRSTFMLLAARLHEPNLARNFLRITIWLAVSGTLWIAGGLVPGDARLTLWLTAVVIEYLGAPFGYYVPGLDRSRTRDWNVEGAHIAERCGLFIIIALGESIIITGATTADRAWDTTTLIAFAAAFVATVAMWWIYFNIGAERAAHQITHSSDPGRIARLVYTYVHLPIIGGIIGSAAADQLVLLHPHGHLAPLEAGLVIGAPALFLLGIFLFKRITGGWWPLSHLAGLALLAVLATAIPFANPLAIGLGTTATLVIVAVWETLSFQPRGAAS